MFAAKSAGKEMVKAFGRLFGHGFAIIAGMMLMITGLGMGVSMVLLPIGIPLGLAGLLMFIWGFFGWSESRPSGATFD
ncbi:MAG TPA: hypothetical protein VL371_01295 [Gemmataceae bacterium]|jgi:hypothetical protein|nr:hypothetical protein [Gemmataceae bacterium]